MLYVAVRALGDWGDFWTRENAEDFVVAPGFTLALVPFLCLVAWESRRELDNPPRALASFRLRGLERLNGAPVLRQSAPVPSSP
jgi:hypothetical protein